MVNLRQERFCKSVHEASQLETAAQADGRTLGEWCREVILRGGSASDAARHDPVLAEIVGVRLLLVNARSEIADDRATLGMGGRLIKPH